MSGTRQPTDLVVFNGRKHLTKKEIEDRKNKEVKIASDNIKPPARLTNSEKKQFKSIAKELINAKIMTNLDVESLAFFIERKAEYLKITKEVRKREPTMVIEVFDLDADGNHINEREKIVIDEDYTALVKLQGNLLNDCRKCASDLGLSISSRCKLVIPTNNIEKQENKYSKLYN